MIFTHTQTANQIKIFHFSSCLHFKLNWFLKIVHVKSVSPVSMAKDCLYGWFRMLRMELILQDILTQYLKISLSLAHIVMCHKIWIPGENFTGDFQNSNFCEFCCRFRPNNFLKVKLSSLFKTQTYCANIKSAMHVSLPACFKKRWQSSAISPERNVAANAAINSTGYDLMT